MNIFYISYDGMTDLVSQSQVLPYIEALAARGNSMSILTFEKKDRPGSAEKIKYYDERLRSNKVHWLKCVYHKSPKIPGAVFDIIQGLAVGIRILHKKEKPIIHARGYIPAIMGIILKPIFKAKLIFDMRGFWPDEKVDAGAWDEKSAIYRIVKWIEKNLLLKSDEIIVLTESAKKFLVYEYHVKANITVIPCCIDVDMFGQYIKYGIPPREAGFKDKFVVIYAGNLGTFYSLDRMLNFFGFLKKNKKNAFFRIISNYPKKIIDEETSRRSISREDYSVEMLDYKDMPLAFSQADVSLIFYNRRLSGAGCCPIKFAESMASGIPVVISSGIGDCDEIIKNNRVGSVLTDFSGDEYKQTFDEISALLSDRESTIRRCVKVAKERLSLKNGIDKYYALYKMVGG